MTAINLHLCISQQKADRLFWMGRYSERVYRTLHILRKYFDRMIDDNPDAYIEFCTKQGIKNTYTSSDDFCQRYLYDETNLDSLICMLELVNDNAIVLREEIMSESLSYIQLAICHLKKCGESNCNLEALQPITDNILAFWGSLDDRINNANVRNMISFGRFIESTDIHIRFGYPYVRIRHLFDRICELYEKEAYLCETETFDKLKANMTFDRYQSVETLTLLNRVFHL
jgi:uncharacterized alpha-E superfamily protein